MVLAVALKLPATGDKPQITTTHHQGPEFERHGAEGGRRHGYADRIRNATRCYRLAE
jgi:hypothetical protein